MVKSYCVLRYDEISGLAFDFFFENLKKKKDRVKVIISLSFPEFDKRLDPI